jgi:cytochrome c556
MNFVAVPLSTGLIATVWLLSLTIVLTEYSSTFASDNLNNIIDQRMQLFKQSGKSIKAISSHIKAGEIELAAKETEFHIEWATEMHDYFPVGSQASISNNSKAGGDIWNDWEKFLSYKSEYQKEAEALKSALLLKNEATIKQSFVAMASACKSCHQSFRN